MNEAIISLGSNTVDREIKLSRAMDIIAGMVKSFTPPYIEDGQPYSNPYLNIVAVIDTELEYSELYDLFKDIETKLGRVKANRDDLPVAIDIDIVIFNDKVVRQRDYASAYFIKGLKILGLQPISH